MPFNEPAVKPIVLKQALHWLNQQPDNWAKYIKDSDVAVKMYRKSQNHNHKACSFKKEIQKVLNAKPEEEDPLKQHSLKDLTGAVLIKKSSPHFKTYIEVQKPTSPPAINSTSCLSEKEEVKTRSPAFVLDKKSLETVMNTKKDLNIQDDQEVLRLLIQIGRKNLDQLWPTPG